MHFYRIKIYYFTTSIHINLLVNVEGKYWFIDEVLLNHFSENRVGTVDSVRCVSPRQTKPEYTVELWPQIEHQRVVRRFPKELFLYFHSGNLKNYDCTNTHNRNVPIRKFWESTYKSNIIIEMFENIKNRSRSFVLFFRKL